MELKQLIRTAARFDLPSRRRDLLRVGSLTFLGINLRRYLAIENVMAAASRPPQGKSEACILLWLNGGPSHVDTWDPKSNSSFKSISTNVPGIEVSELLPRVSRHMDKLAIIRSMYSEENNHGKGHHYVMTGHRPSPTMKFPALGSIITRETTARNGVPPNVMVPKIHPGYLSYFKSHFIGSEYDPIFIPDPNDDDFAIPDLRLPKSLTTSRIHQRETFLDVVDGLYRRRLESAEHTNVDTFRKRALNMILSENVRRAFDISTEPDKLRDAYGRHTLGQSALIARRLVESGTRFVTVSDLHREATGRDWDTHGKNDEQHRDHLVPQLDQTLTVLLTDLEDRGLLDNTMVIAMGEFGRTPDINSGGGRDHWCHCWSLALAGGGIRGGQVIGESDRRGAYVSDRMVTIGDLFATIYKAFGIDWTTEYLHPVGRPLKIANSLNDETGEPVEELV
jgi:hypothetical protein